jgi:hypothetical protein
MGQVSGRHSRGLTGHIEKWKLTQRRSGWNVLPIWLGSACHHPRQRRLIVSTEVHKYTHYVFFREGQFMHKSVAGDFSDPDVVIQILAQEFVEDEGEGAMESDRVPMFFFMSEHATNDPTATPLKMSPKYFLGGRRYTAEEALEGIEGVPLEAIKEITDQAPDADLLCIRRGAVFLTALNNDMQIMQWPPLSARMQ